MARRKKRKLRLVKGKPRKRTPPTCKAKTIAGARCLRQAKGRTGACGLKPHQEQVRGVKAGAVNRREPAKHQAKCKACKSRARARAESEWIGGGFTDAEAAKMIGCSARAWQRHCSYMKLYDVRANEGLGPLLFKIIEKALKAPARLSDAVSAANLLNKIAQGGERIIIEAIDRLRDQERAGFFAALDELGKVEGELTAQQFIEILVAKLQGDGQEDGRVH